MDLLGSIMKKMERPPGLDEKERKRIQTQKEQQKRIQAENERRMKEFRDGINAKINAFNGNHMENRLVFDTMNKVQRAVLHDMSETAGLIAHSFGQEEVDRHVVLFKPDEAPSEGELNALRRGDVYIPGLNTDDDRREVEEEEEQEVAPKKVRGKKNLEPQKYLQKYEKRLGGLDVDKEAAKSTKDCGRSYGVVSSEQKRDKRTIEETLEDIKQRKKNKTS